MQIDIDYARVNAAATARSLQINVTRTRPPRVTYTATSECIA